MNDSRPFSFCGKGSRSKRVRPRQSLGARYPIVSCRPGCKVHAWPVNSDLVGVEVHWVDGRHRRCVREEHDCLWCRAGLPIRWKGYLAALEPRAKQRFILDIAEGPGKKLDALIVAGEDLTAFHLTLERAAGSAFGRVALVAEKWGTFPFAKVESHDVGATLEYLYELADTRIELAEPQ